MTKKDSGLLANYKRARYTSIWEAYQKPSQAKQRAEQHIREEMFVRGYGYKVCSNNIRVFTCAYLYDENDKTYMVYHTHANTYLFDTEGEI